MKEKKKYYLHYFITLIIFIYNKSVLIRSIRVIGVSLA